MKTIQIFAALIFAVFFSCNQKNNSKLNKDYEPLAIQLCDHLFSSPKYMMYETDFLNSIHYAEVCAAYGAIKFARQSENKDLIKKLMDRYEPLKKDSIAWQNHHVDGNVYGILPFEFFEVTGEPEYLNHGLYLANSQWDSLSFDSLTYQTRFWIDDVFMVGSLQVEAYKATEEPKYLDRAARFTAAYVDSLQQNNGLFYHGPDAPIHWGRGNGWMAVGMAITLTELPKDHPLYGSITDGYKRMMKSLLQYQGENGMWKQIIDMPEAWDETSCTAMFAYAISVGLNRGILLEDSYDLAVRKALDALKIRVNERGELTGVCAGTGQSQEIQYYLDRPRIDGDFHGQAPLLWLIESINDTTS